MCVGGYCVWLLQIPRSGTTIAMVSFAVRVTTRQLEEDAKAIADSIALRGFNTQVHSWELSGSEVFDVYVMHLSSMVDAAEVAEGLGEDGWDADLVVFPQTR
mgnify:CR=1 FL=1